MNRTDRRDDADVGAGDLAELRDLSEAAHAHLDEAELGVGLQPPERQRHAELRVVARLGRDRARHRRAERGEDVLRRRLARRAGDADDAGGAAGAEQAADGGQRGVLVLGHERRCALPSRGRDELPPAAHGHEEISRPGEARVDRQPRHRACSLEHAQAERAELVQLDRDHEPPFPRSASRATSRSSKGSFSDPISWPCSWPLPAITTTSPGCACDSARRIALRRSGIDLHVRPRALEDVLDDRERLLAAWVVGGHDHEVGQVRRDLAHQRALAAIAVATRTEDDEQPPGGEVAGRAQDVVERVRCVRVVDKHGERLPLVDGLEPSGHTRERGEPRCDRLVVDVEQLRGGDGAENVLDVEAPAQGRAQVDPSRPEARAGGIEPKAFGTDLGVVGEPEGDERRPPGLRELLGEPAPQLVADVHSGRGRRRTREEAALGGVVVLHRPVEVEMVLGQVREHERVEADAVESAQRRRMRRGFERDAAVAGVEHLAERALEVDRLGRRADDRAHLAADAALHRAEQAGTLPILVEDRPEQVRGRRLSVRARDPRHGELLRRLAEEQVGRDRHRHARFVDDELRHRLVRR